MTAKIIKTCIVYWCFLICLGSPLMASSLADKYEDQNKRIEINPDLQAYVEAREAENRLVIEKGKLHILGVDSLGAFRKSGKYSAPRDYNTDWFGFYELENKLFGFVQNADSRLICDGRDYPLRLELVALAKRDDIDSYTFKASASYNKGPFFKRGIETFELNLKTKSCFYEKRGRVAKCEIISPNDSYNFSGMTGGNVQQRFEAGLRKMPKYLERLRGCKFRE
jgi:hypothetical protein